MTPLRYPLGGMPPQQKPGMPAQGGKGGSPMPAQGGKGGRPMPAQGGKGGRPMPAQGGKGLSQTLPPPGQGSTMPAQGGKGQNFGPNVFPAPQVQQPQIPAQGGKAPLTQEQIAALGPVINNRPMLPPGVQMPVGLPARPISPQVMPANMAPQQGIMGLQKMLAGRR